MAEKQLELLACFISVHVNYINYGDDGFICVTDSSRIKIDLSHMSEYLLYIMLSSKRQKNEFPHSLLIAILSFQLIVVNFYDGCVRNI